MRMKQKKKFKWLTQKTEIFKSVLKMVEDHVQGVQFMQPQEKYNYYRINTNEKLLLD